MKTPYLSILVFIIILLVSNSCETNPPNYLEEIKKFGKVFITSNVDSCEIFIDEISTGKITPDTISVEVGNHLISLHKNGFHINSTSTNILQNEISQIQINLTKIGSSKIVLLEDFANVSCGPCVSANIIIEEISSELKEKLVVIKYSSNFPSPNDPFFSSVPSTNNERMQYYNILFVPTVIIDGIIKPISEKEDIVNSINTRLIEPAPFTLTVSDSQTANKYYTEVNSTLLNTNYDYSKCNLFIVVVEKEISFDNPPGSNGETQFYHVMRSIKQIDLSTKFNNDQFSYLVKSNFDVKNEWNLNNITVVAFIQNKETKEVLQSTKVSN